MMERMRCIALFSACDNRLDPWGTGQGESEAARDARDQKAGGNEREFEAHGAG
jgi:hypothetical protein